MTDARPPERPALRRLHPVPAGTTTVEDAYDVPRPPPPGRPWIELCMVTSLDGSVVVDGGSGALGNPNDRAVLLGLRRLADVVLVGAGTVRAEGYGAPSAPGLRIGVVTNSGHLDLDADLFASGAGFLIAPETAAIDERRVEVVRAGHREVDLAIATARLDAAVPGVRHVHAEGGPGLNAALFAADVVDAIALTTSPRIVGGDGVRLTVGAPELDRKFDLAHVLVDDDAFVFTRWVRRR